jgi:predicted O-methyltransferase YrrM
MTLDQDCLLCILLGLGSNEQFQLVFINHPKDQGPDFIHVVWVSVK